MEISAHGTMSRSRWNVANFCLEILVGQKGPEKVGFMLLIINRPEFSIYHLATKFCCIMDKRNDFGRRAVQCCHSDPYLFLRFSPKIRREGSIKCPKVTI